MGLRASAPAAMSRRAPNGARGISRVLSPRGGGSFLWDRRYRRPRAAYPGLRWRGPRLVPYLALLRVGFAVRPLLPAARCALTAPFHPYLCRSRGHRRYAFCGTFRRLSTPGRYPAPCPLELGLSSSNRSCRRSSLATLFPVKPGGSGEDPWRQAPPHARPGGNPHGAASFRRERPVASAQPGHPDNEGVGATPSYAFPRSAMTTRHGPGQPRPRVQLALPVKGRIVVPHDPTAAPTAPSPSLHRYASQTSEHPRQVPCSDPGCPHGRAPDGLALGGVLLDGVAEGDQGALRGPHSGTGGGAGSGDSPAAVETGIWIVVVVLAFSTLAKSASSSARERVTGTPAAFLLCIASTIVALGG